MTKEDQKQMRIGVIAGVAGIGLAYVVVHGVILFATDPTFDLLILATLTIFAAWMLFGPTDK